MHRYKKYNPRNVWLLRLLVLILIAASAYAISALRNSEAIYTEIARSVSKQPTYVHTSKLEGTAVKIPTYDMFKAGNLWALVSKKRPLTAEAGYKLVDIPVAHGDKTIPMKIAVDIRDELEQLVNAAEADGESLMVSSAYRSLSDQKAVYSQFVMKNGEAAAKQYVSPVGASEHHTGLAVDLSSLSDECADDSNACSLSQDGAAWLAENTYRFGFIQRYPAGKQEITGVAYEPWHFRFVGKPLAKIMNSTDLTFDEAVAELAPGYAKSR